MTFKEIKQMVDYKFTLYEVKDIIHEIRNGCIKSLYSDGNGYIGAAVLEIGYVDIELNIFTYGQCNFTANSEDKRPLLDYFVCVKRGEENDDWESMGYLNCNVNVDWNADNWKDQLEKDMFDKLDKYVKDHSYSYDHAN